jgi:adenylate cyclase
MAIGRAPSRQQQIELGETTRLLSAIVCADVVGYSRLMSADEDDTHRRMMRLQSEIISPQVAAFSGRIVKYTGDGFLAVFATAKEAVDCVVALQSRLIADGKEESPSRRIAFRMSINYADLIFEAGDVFGDGVNIAARLQAYAEAGGIIVSEAVVQEIGTRKNLHFSDFGHLPLKNISQKIRAFGVKSGRSATPLIGEAIVGGDGPPSIVVLPFREHNVRPGEEYFGEGIVDDIIHALAGLKELFVISRGSALGLSQGGFDVRAIGRELGVRYVMHGSVQRSDVALRIRTELCNAETGEIVYSDQHQGERKDLFDLQARIADRVVSKLAPQVRDRERLRAMRKHPQNMTAYDLVLQALGPLFAMDYEAFSVANGLLKHAIATDSFYGPAYSYASYWHLLRVGQGWSNDVAADSEEAARQASAAIDLDKNDALALAIYGHVHSYLKRDLEMAVELQERAIDVGPSCAMAWTLSSVTRGYLGHGAIAVSRAERGLQLSPRGAHVVYHEHILSQAHYLNSNFEEAVRWGLRAAKNNERLTSNMRCLVASLIAAERITEGEQAALRLMELDPEMNLSDFAKRTPLTGAMRDDFVARLRRAGIPG